MPDAAGGKTDAGAGEKGGCWCDHPNVRKGAAVAGAVAVFVLAILLAKKAGDEDDGLDTKGSVARASSREDYLEFARGQSY